VRIGVDPLGSAGVHYWDPIIARYGIAVTVVNDAVDPTFHFMTVDWDGKIRTDCSSPYAMVPFVAMRDRFDVAFANDADHDRHGIAHTDGGIEGFQSLPGRRDFLFVHASPQVVDQGRGRQDRGQQRHHRPCDKGIGTPSA
jgi:phosphoglucomutase